MANQHGTHIDEAGNVNIVIPLPPRTKKNHQQIFYKKKETEKGDTRKVPFVSPSSQYQQYAKDCGVFVRPLQIDYPVNVKALYYMPTLRTVDLPNLNEALHDILVEYGMLVNDDCRIIVSTDGSRVCYDKENPRTEVTIEKTEATFPQTKRKRGGRKNGQCIRSL